MTRPTSVAAYHYLMQSGALSARRREIYDLVYQHGPGTSGEMVQRLIATTRIKSLTQSRARFTELRERGLLQELGTRPCAVTSRKVIVWEVTDRVKPLPVPKKRTKAEQYAAEAKLYSAKVQRYADLVEVLVRWMDSTGMDKAAAFTRQQVKDIEGQ